MASGDAGQDSWTVNAILNAQRKINEDGSEDMLLTEATSDTIDYDTSAFDASTVGSSLFVGYLISGAGSHDLDYYANSSVAYFCIQGRAIAASAWIMAMILQSLCDQAVAKIMTTKTNSEIDQDDQTNPEEKIAPFVTNALYKIVDEFYEEVDWLRRIITGVNYMSLIVFAVGFLLSLWSQYREMITFDVFWIIIGLTIAGGASVMRRIYKEFFKALQKINNKPGPYRPAAGSLI